MEPSSSKAGSATQQVDDVLSHHPLDLPTWTTLESAEPESATSDEEDQLNTTPPRSPSVSSRKRKHPASPFETPKPRAKFPRTAPTRKSAQRIEKSIVPGGVLQSPFKLQHSPNPVFFVQASSQSVFQPSNNGANNRRVSFQDIPPLDRLSLFEVTADSVVRGHVEVAQSERLPIQGTSSSQPPAPKSAHQDISNVGGPPAKPKPGPSHGWGTRAKTRDTREPLDKLLGTIEFSCGMLPTPPVPFNLDEKQLSKHMSNLIQPHLRHMDHRAEATQVMNVVQKQTPRKVYSVPQWSRDGEMHLRMVSLFGPGYAKEAGEKPTKAPADRRGRVGRPKESEVGADIHPDTVRTLGG